MQGVSEPISRILTQVGIHFQQKRGLVYQISCQNCNAVYVGDTGRSVRTRQREHVDAVEIVNAKKSALSQHESTSWISIIE